MSASQQLLGQAVEADDRATEALRQAERAVGVAVGDEDRARALVGERARGQLAGLACAEDHHVAFRQRAEHAQREVDRDRGDAHAARADLRLRAHALARRQRRREQAIGQRSRRARAHRRLVRAPDLPLDLRLADDHRLEARRHPVELPGGVAVARRVDRLGQLRRADPGAACKQAEYVSLGLHRPRPPRGRPPCGCRWRSRPPRAPPRSPSACVANSLASCSVNARRSRSATGAVLCEMPRASSSLMPTSTPGSAALRAACPCVPRAARRRVGVGGRGRPAPAGRPARARFDSGARP